VAVRVILATPLRHLAEGLSAVEVEASTVQQALEELCARFPALRERLFSDGGAREDVRVFLNRRDIRGLGGLASELHEGDELSLVPLVAGA
jgi:molybdopterin synthase sulfur carrier subunit